MKKERPLTCEGSKKRDRLKVFIVELDYSTR